jgi:hypothetical protein
MTAMEYKRWFCNIPKTVPDRLVNAYITNMWKRIFKAVDEEMRKRVDLEVLKC